MVEIGAATLSAIHGEQMRFDGAELVARPFPDVRAGHIADVVEVEADHPAESRALHGCLRALQAFAPQALVVDTALPVTRIDAEGGGGVRTVVVHRFFGPAS
jgi:hypothetical protein